VNYFKNNEQTTCSGPVPGQNSQAHIGVLSGTNSPGDLTLNGIDYFDGTMVMGDGDTAFAIGATNSDYKDRVLAFNANTGNALWSSTSTSDIITPVATTASGGLVITDNSGPNVNSSASLVRYDGSGNATQSTLTAASYSYSWGGGWNVTGTDGTLAAISNSALDVAASSWGSLGGSPSKTNAASKSINEIVRHSIADIGQGNIGSTNWTSNHVTCNLFVSDVIEEALQGTGLQAPQTERVRILPAIPPLSCSTAVFTTQIPALAADWGDAQQRFALLECGFGRPGWSAARRCSGDG